MNNNINVITQKEELYDKCENMEELYDKFYYPLLVEYNELKKQVEQYQEEVCILDMRTDENIKYKNQQKEFINYLEDEIKFHKNRDSYMVVDIFGSYDLNDIKLKLLEEILKKYKEIIGDDK